MSEPKILTGAQLVEKGASKHDAMLPEIGLKDVIPNGSWLEQKQIQAALEARKHLLEVEKIEKSGNLSHAEWDAERNLAAVQKQAGGYWQYHGHHSGGQLYLWPEEALFLMEVNCLRLTFNEVTVSLQQAYSVLLKGKINISQYKVYSSLSRLGYKVFRHEFSAKDEANVEKSDTIDTKEQTLEHSQENRDVEMQDQNVIEKADDTTEVCSALDEESKNANNDESESQEIKTLSEEKVSRKELKLQKLRERKSFYKTQPENSFENIPEMCRKVKVKIGVPEQNLFPRNVFPNKMVYDLDLDRVKLKNAASPTHRERSNSTSDESNNELRCLNEANTNWSPRIISQRFHPRYQCGPRFWNFDRPRYSNAMFNMFAQRPFFYNQPNFNFPPRGPFFSVRPPMLLFRPTNHFRGKRKRSHEESRGTHLRRIKYLASKLKQLNINGTIQQDSVEALKNLLRTYNLRYNTKLCLVNDFDLVEDERIETIELEDDEPRAKVAKNNEDTKNYKKRFSELKELAQTLKVLDSKHMLYSRHRRAFSGLVREFNKTYKADVYLNCNNDVIDRNLIVLDSSDSDCVVEKSVVESKKVLNPFNVLRLKSRKDDEPCTSSAKTENVKSSETFERWISNDDDFGKREVITKSAVRELVADYEKEMYMFDFLKQYTHYIDHKNWNEVKTLFWESIEEESVEVYIENHVSKESLLKVEDCKDMASALQKLRVIPSCHTVLDDCSFNVHFDVYNKDVQNFKKSNKPRPHFRICCVSDSSDFPTGAEVATLHSKYVDNVPIVFAIVSSGSIAYLQVKPEDIPVYNGREE